MKVASAECHAKGSIADLMLFQDDNGNFFVQYSAYCSPDSRIERTTQWTSTYSTAYEAMREGLLGSLPLLKTKTNAVSGLV